MLAPAVEQGQRCWVATVATVATTQAACCIIAPTHMGPDEKEVWGRWASPSYRANDADRDERTDKAVTDYSNAPRDSTRVPLVHRIQLKFDRFSGFIDEYISNLSPGGVFIRTETPEPPGQLLDFEFRLGDGYELIRGRGEVAWARQRAEGPERPPGMGIRFTELSAGGQDLIYKIVDDYAAHGGKPFDLTPPPSSGAPRALAAEAAPPETPETPATPATPAIIATPPRPPPAAKPADRPSLPWTLEMPAIRPIPGVPAITPRSPLESLGAGAGAGQLPRNPLGMDGTSATPRPPATPASPATPRIVGSAPPDPLAPSAPTSPASGTSRPVAAGPPMDPLEQMLASLRPLDDLAPAATVAPAAAAPLPVAPPSFSAFDLRTPRRRSRLPLFGLLVAVALLGVTIYLLRDTLLAWIEKHESTRAASAPLAQTTRGARKAHAPLPTAASPLPGGRGASPRSPALTVETRPAVGPPPPPSSTPTAASSAAARSAGGAAAGALPGAVVGARVTAVERITWEASPGATEVVLWGNGEFTAQSYTRARVAGLPAREVVRLIGITRPFPQPRLAVHTPEVAQIRTGYHASHELHVVLDLGDPAVEVASVEQRPHQLRLHLRSR